MITPPSSKNYESNGSNHSTLNKSRGLRKSVTKTSNGFHLKQQPREPLSPSPLIKRKRTSASPEKSICSVSEFKRIIYVTEDTREKIPFEQINAEEKVFVLAIPVVNFKRADVVTILKTCESGVVYQLEGVVGRHLYIDYKGVEGIGLSDDVPYLNFKKISINIAGLG